MIQKELDNYNSRNESEVPGYYLTQSGRQRSSIELLGRSSDAGKGFWKGPAVPSAGARPRRAGIRSASGSRTSQTSDDTCFPAFRMPSTLSPALLESFMGPSPP